MIRHKANSFTLVEMIGAMAILAILASVLAPSVVRQIQTATAVGEDTKMDDIAQALTNGIRATGIIPNPNLNPTNTNANGFGWAYLASNYTRLSGSNLVSVFPGLTNDTYRRLYLSTNLVGTASNGGFANTMTNWGAVMFPTNAKMYLVSASRPDFTLALATNGAGAQTTDNSYANSAVSSLDGWVKQFSDGVTVAPANIVGSWTNRGEFLHVRTIDIASIFNETRTAQQKAIEQEDKNLDEIARALVASIQETGTIPNPAISASVGWVAQVAGYSSMGANAIQYSFPANRIGERRLYLDLSLNPYVGGPPPGGWNVLPVVPASAYLVSVSKEDDTILNLNTANGGAQALGAADLTFLRTWQKVPDSSGVYIANNANIVSADWANRGEFLHVRSIDLRSLFCRVELEDLRGPATSKITRPGSGYVNTFIDNQNGLSLSFTAVEGVLSSVSIVSTGKNLWSNSGGTGEATSLSKNVSAGSGTNGLVELSFPIAPTFASGSGALDIMPTQTVVFYLLKGGSINLSGGIQVIQQDSKFQYSNGTWTQSY